MTTDETVKQLAELRSKLDLPQEEIARRLGCSVATVSRWETGERQPSARYRARIAALLSNGGAPALVRPTLPHDRSSFVGRGSEISALEQLWGSSRLLTLTGAGGIGKSRLARELVRFTGEPIVGVVALDHVQTVEQLPAAIAEALGLPTAPPTRATVLLDLTERSGALLLDTCEHVTGPVRSFVDLLLDQAPGITVLATSQVPIAARGERVWRVPALDFDGPRSDAVQLFLHRASDRSSPIEPVPAVLEICRRLQGVPLSLELAAAWMVSMSPEQLLENWDSRAALFQDPAAPFPRHRDISTAINWSAGLLAPSERELAVQLSVFVGGFTLDQAVTVIGDPDLPLRLRRLVEASWLEYHPAEPAHFTMLDSIHSWCAEHLAASGSLPELQRRLADHLLALSEAARDDNFRADRGWPERLRLAAPLIAASLSWSEIHNPDWGRRTAVTLLSWWRRAGRSLEGRMWLERFISTDLGVATAQARCALALTVLDLGDHEAAAEHASLALASLDSLDRGADVVWVVRALSVLSACAHIRRDHPAAARFADQAIAAARSLPDGREAALTANNLGILAGRRGDFAAAEAFHRESLRIKRRLSDRQGLALGMANLADLFTAQRRFLEAAELIDEGLTIAHALQDGFLVSLLEINAGENLLAQGSPLPAAERFLAARTRTASLALSQLRIEACRGLGEALLAAGRREEGLTHLRESRDLAETMGDENTLAQLRRLLTTYTGGPQEVRPPYDLTRREEEVVRHLLTGRSDAAIAATLRLSPKTVQTHLRHVREKLGVQNRSQIILLALESGLRPTHPH